MSKPEVAAVKPRSLAKGLIAGLIGGLAGTVAKTFAERMFPPRAQDEPGPPTLATEGAKEHAIVPDSGRMAAAGIRWGLGAAAGAAYGAIVEFYPAATAKEGASFGLVIEALTQETMQPAPGLSAEIEDLGTLGRAGEVTSFVVYGVTTEFVRSFVRRWL